MLPPSGVAPAHPRANDNGASSSTGLSTECTPLVDVRLSAVDVAALAGWSYRQLDFALRCGHITCENDGRGHGSRRWFTLAQARRVILIAWLGSGGLTPAQAVDLLDGTPRFMLAAFGGGDTE